MGGAGGIGMEGFNAASASTTLGNLRGRIVNVVAPPPAAVTTSATTTTATQSQSQQQSQQQQPQQNPNYAILFFESQLYYLMT
jgi:hypothetical protein